MIDGIASGILRGLQITAPALQSFGAASGVMVQQTVAIRSIIQFKRLNGYFM
jgi:hypothetical protein